MYCIKTYHPATIIVGDTPVSAKDAMDLIGQARDNKKKVIEGAAAVEYNVAKTILRHFYPDDSDRSKEFDEMILRSDWCSFAAKRKLIHWIVDKRHVLEGKEKERYEKLLRDTMSYRNAFTHGELSSDGVSVFLSYFEGTPRRQQLTDEFWVKVESTLTEAYTVTRHVAERSGAFKPGKENPDNG